MLQFFCYYILKNTLLMNMSKQININLDDVKYKMNPKLTKCNCGDNYVVKTVPFVKPNTSKFQSQTVVKISQKDAQKRNSKINALADLQKKSMLTVQSRNKSAVVPTLPKVNQVTPISARPPRVYWHNFDN